MCCPSLSRGSRPDGDGSASPPPAPFSNAVAIFDPREEESDHQDHQDSDSALDHDDELSASAVAAAASECAAAVADSAPSSSEEEEEEGGTAAGSCDEVHSSSTVEATAVDEREPFSVNVSGIDFCFPMQLTDYAC